MRDWIVITGPTASGKTAVAVRVAENLGGEILSIDSRQVYKGLDIGTGKDLDEYYRHGIPYHLINIAEPGENYHLAQFQQDFVSAVKGITGRGKVPVLCGGSGLYLEAVLEEHRYTQVPVDTDLRERLHSLSIEKLRGRYDAGNPLNFPVDRDSKKRLIRAIEIQQNQSETPAGQPSGPPDVTIYLITPSRETRRQLISKRLRDRILQGLIEEVSGLRTSCSDDTLLRMGLEYKFVTMYLRGEVERDEMIRELETAIHQFGKRQMTWFRRMGKRGYRIVTLDESKNTDEKVNIITESFSKGLY